MTNRKIFLGCGATVVGFASTPTLIEACNVSINVAKAQPMDTSKLLRFDWSQSLRKAPFADALFDDRGVQADGKRLPDLDPTMRVGIGITTIGDYWPTGSYIGGLYIEQKHFLDNLDVIEHSGFTWPPQYWKAWELVSLAYEGDAPDKHRRYVGFHGRVLKAVGRVIKVEVFHPGSDGTKSRGTWWFDLDDETECDGSVVSTLLSNGSVPGKKEFDAIDVLTPDSDPAKPGAIFIALQRAAQLYDNTHTPLAGYGLRSPKLPFYLGG